MAARVLHFGCDDCHRLLVLQRAGYEVTGASSPADLRAHLGGPEHWDCVALSEETGIEHGAPLRAIRQATSAPVVLFRRTGAEIDERAFDLTIDWLTGPMEWLGRLDLVMKQNHAHAASPRLAPPGHSKNSTAAQREIPEPGGSSASAAKASSS